MNEMTRKLFGQKSDAERICDALEEVNNSLRLMAFALLLPAAHNDFDPNGISNEIEKILESYSTGAKQ